MSNEQGHTHGASGAEALALLNYMADHSAHHAEELRELAAALSETAAAHVREAAALLDASAQKLRQALKETEG